MIVPGRRAPAFFMGLGVLVATTLGSCSQSNDSTAGSTTDPTGGEECLTDLATPTATYEIKTANRGLLGSFLMSDAAVVHVDYAAPQARVLGSNESLQAALDDSRVWAVASEGFLVENEVPGRETPAQLALVDSAGRVTPVGPHFEQVDRVQLIGDQFLVDNRGEISAIDLATGVKVEQEYVEPAATSAAISSSVVATTGGTNGSVLDSETGEKFDLDEVLEAGEKGEVSIAGSSTNQVLLRSPVDDRTTRYWTWSSADGLREAYTSTGEQDLEDRSAAGVCGELVYLVQGDELQVIDTGDDDAVLSSRPMAVDDDASSGYEVDAIPGGVLVQEVDGTGDTTTYMWFDG